MFAGAASAETWNMPVPYGDNNFHTLNHMQFAKDLDAATSGGVSIKVHPSGSLFKHPEIKGAVRSGQVQLGEFLLSRLSNENPVFGVDSVPFLAKSYDDAKKLWAVSRPVIEELLDKQGLMVLYAVPWPPQGLYAKKPVAKPDDMAGLKFRAYNAATERLAQIMKAVPTQVEVADLAQAFSTGRVDAMVTSPSTGFNTKAWDFLTNYYDVQAWLPKNIVVMNKRAFQRLDKATQEAVLAAAAKAEERGWAASMAETGEKTKGLADNGIKVAPPSDELLAALIQAGETMTNEWLEQAGDAGKRLVEAFRK
ncbi:MAG: TRAP transporter substrate-binding protein [Hyphomicrobiales bacterium]|nr:TRAP transporter substrate-binding protein [Hyphomicrobiales bacterium]